ncbi:DUF2178 domain-containing protein [Thermococcus waiotapuensis]|uniref:DUF2178 domain-containing protein n=1 Tax=Thermococcus waiotapuensis TaxID=90909 RepID=A0AAE4T0U6_9EURY|nr:DUF2178 domain-containing protein [Thermococcus waiotapuensis]MDV3103565.1 DUF2178 domain-containing protein [Thermococcus waiotapuensis]
MGRKLALLPALLSVMALGWVVGWEVSSGKGEIFEDERSLRIDEVASRMTLQMTMMALAVVMLLLSGRTPEPEAEGAFIAVGLTLAGMGAAHLLLRHYYARVM